jgi:hypothetical protein
VEFSNNTLTGTIPFDCERVFVQSDGNDVLEHCVYEYDDDYYEHDDDFYFNDSYYGDDNGNYTGN